MVKKGLFYSSKSGQLPFGYDGTSIFPTIPGMPLVSGIQQKYGIAVADLKIQVFKFIFLMILLCSSYQRLTTHVAFNTFKHSHWCMISCSISKTRMKLTLLTVCPQLLATLH